MNKKFFLVVVYLNLISLIPRGKISFLVLMLSLNFLPFQSFSFFQIVNNPLAMDTSQYSIKVDSSESEKNIKKSKISPLLIGNAVLKKHGYKAAVDTLLRMEKALLPNAPFQEKSKHYQALMIFCSLMGDNFNSINYEEKAQPFLYSSNIDIFSKRYKIENAVEYIINRYSNEKIIMFNEERNRGQNRAFVRSLLPGLYEAGFRYIAAEALDTRGYIDSKLNDRGYPVKKTGYYIRESAYAQFIREALAIGFKFVAYDDTSNSPDKNKQEEEQANNIFQFVKQNPSSKIIVLAGHAHIYKQRLSTPLIRMGERLCKLTGKNIPAIDCTTLKEYNNRRFMSSVYLALSDSLKIKEPSVLLIDDSAFVAPKLKGKVDVCVYLPPTNYELGYPDWLKEPSDTAINLSMPKNINLANSFLQVFKADEWDREMSNAIPVLQFIIPEGKHDFNLFLKKGRYYVFVNDKDDRMLFRKEFELKNYLYTKIKE